MNLYRIEINGKIVNIFEGKNEDDALNNYAYSEGYKSWRVMQYNNEYKDPDLKSGVKVTLVGKVPMSTLSKKDLDYLSNVESADAKRYEIIYKGKHVGTTRAESLEELKEKLTQDKFYKNTSDIEIYDVKEDETFSFEELFKTKE